jgi:dihydropteroate synthase
MDEEKNKENGSISLGRYDKAGYKEITMDKPKEIDATGMERPWRMDPKGYFLIRVNEKLGKIEAAFCDIKENKVRVIIRGDNPVEVYTAMLKEDLISLLDHAADIGVELEKAYIAMKEGKKYTQDKVELEE